MKSKSGKALLTVLIIVALLVVVAITSWSSVINLMLPADSRPGNIHFPTERVSSEEFEAIAARLTETYNGDFDHIKRFREAGILAYEGPKTCLKCHEDMEVTDLASGKAHTEKLMDNLTKSAHYRFFTVKHPNVYGFNGELADDFPMGKINRPCPKPGSFAMTAWAELFVTEHGDTMSEGCGQCHIGGQYQAPLGEIMPAYKTKEKEKEAIDCLICHAVAYDMNEKQVVMDDNGRKRWAQDRSMEAALSVTMTTAQSCLRCHQHNLGGDIYVDSLDASFMQSLENTGKSHPRVLHPGSKRGTPFSPSWDVHAAAGVNCTECHLTEGHRIAKGTHTTTMMANDLPDVEVSCINCHDAEPHSANPDIADYLNGHLEKVACVTCHIPSLSPDNATMRDFANPVFEEEVGIYVYDDIEKETAPGKGIKYVWWNGDGTFLGNPIGDNPNGENLYRFYEPTNIWPEYSDFDYVAWYEEIMRPIARKKPSKLYAMKLFNGRQHIDLQNTSPFGGMYLPYNLPTYYTTGSADLAAQKEMEKSMMKMMYGKMFKYYLMDKFMGFLDAGEWRASAYEDAHDLKNVDPRWIPADAMMEISHSIRKEGLRCIDCHSENGILDWKALGYTPDEIASLIEER